MTREQTAVYDGSDERACRELMRELTQEAQRLADETGHTVEIYTADGIVAEVRYPQG